MDGCDCKETLCASCRKQLQANELQLQANELQLQANNLQLQAKGFELLAKDERIAQLQQENVTLQEELDQAMELQSGEILAPKAETQTPCNDVCPEPAKMEITVLDGSEKRVEPVSSRAVDLGIHQPGSAWDANFTVATRDIACDDAESTAHKPLPIETSDKPHDNQLLVPKAETPMHCDDMNCDICEEETGTTRLAARSTASKTVSPQPVAAEIASRAVDGEKTLTACNTASDDVCSDQSSGIAVAPLDSSANHATALNTQKCATKRIIVKRRQTKEGVKGQARATIVQKKTTYSNGITIGDTTAKPKQKRSSLVGSRVVDKLHENHAKEPSRTRRGNKASAVLGGGVPVTGAAAHEEKRHRKQMGVKLPRNYEMNDEKLEMLKVPLLRGWTREIRSRRTVVVGKQKADIYYFPPAKDKVLRSGPAVQVYLDKNNINDITAMENFTFRKIRLNCQNEVYSNAARNSTATNFQGKNKKASKKVAEESKNEEATQEMKVTDEWGHMEGEGGMEAKDMQEETGTGSADPMLADGDIVHECEQMNEPLQPPVFM